MRLARIWLVFIVLKLLIFPVAVIAKPLALQGYDPVAYFNGFPSLGEKQYAVDHQGSTYWFSSRENREIFKGKPEYYLPQFHGFCATSFKRGVERSANPKIYLLVDEKLFLFSSLAAMQWWMVDPGA